MTDILGKCYEKAIQVIKLCSTPHGLFASAGKDGYNAVWARDSMISLIGASLSNNFKDVFKQSIITLSKEQSKNGQMPNCVDKFSNRKPHVDYQSIDSSLWYIIGNYVYKSRYKDNSLLKIYKNNIKKALIWLSCQDIGENNLLAQLPTSDWQDAFPHKYGYTINTQALYYAVLNLIGRKKEAEKLKFMVNKNEETKLWSNSFYLPYRWKNHGRYKEIGNWFDSLGNLLAIIFNLADKKKAEKIISYIQKNRIELPYPVKTIYPPIIKGSKNWQDYFKDCDARLPWHYSNGGIWGYNGCFYALALIKIGKLDEAGNQLKKLAEADLNGNFPEWINPITKEPHGKLQAWNAGMYIAAYESLKRKNVLFV